MAGQARSRQIMAKPAARELASGVAATAAARHRHPHWHKETPRNFRNRIELRHFLPRTNIARRMWRRSECAARHII